MENHKHAIVIGASMGGLLATRVLADHFEQVTLVERDAFPPRANTAAACLRAVTPTACWQAANKWWNICSPEFHRS
jgi:2-polyprenyl-6-methoxyphenol hydroxylase-like FAD-dependent oxidoreductase